VTERFIIKVEQKGLHGRKNSYPTVNWVGRERPPLRNPHPVPSILPGRGMGSPRTGRIYGGRRKKMEPPVLGSYLLLPQRGFPCRNYQDSVPRLRGRKGGEGGSDLKGASLCSGKVLYRCKVLTKEQHESGIFPPLSIREEGRRSIGRARKRLLCLFTGRPPTEEERPRLSSTPI